MAQILMDPKDILRFKQRLSDVHPVTYRHVPIGLLLCITYAYNSNA